jgi:hypothetical protein
MGLNRIFLLAATVLLVLCGPSSAQKPLAGGKRNPAPDTILRNEPPIASLTASITTITLPCSVSMVSQSGTCPANVTTAVQLKTIATDPELDALVYKYSVDAGRIDGEGASVSWDLGGVGPGTYRASVKVDDGLGGITNAITTVTLVACPDCVPSCALCPSISTSCQDAVDQGMPITFTAGGGLGSLQAISYKWTVSAGTITSGQGTSAITVSTDGLGGQNVTATVQVSGLDPACPNQGSCTTPVRPLGGHPRKFDEYGNIRFNDEKSRLDNFAIQLQNEPAALGYIVVFGSCDGEGRARGNRARDYLVETHGLNAGRVTVIDGACGPALMVDLWILPQGVPPPTTDLFQAVSPCPPCKKTQPPRLGTRRKVKE